MNDKKYRQIRVIVAFFVGAIVSIGVTKNSFLLSVFGVITGMIFLALVRTKTKITIDEREITLREKAAHLTYAVFTPTIAIGALLMLLPTHGGLSVFSKGEFLFLESLGMIFAYLSLLLIAIYSISYHFLNKRYGGSGDE